MPLSRSLSRVIQCVIIVGVLCLVIAVSVFASHYRARPNRSKTKNMDQNRYYPPLPDYPSRLSALLNGNHLDGKLLSNALSLSARLETSVDQVYQNLSQGKDYSVYTGYSGLALTYFFLYRTAGKSNALHTAQYLVQAALKKLNGKEISFLNGDAGPLTIGILMNLELNQQNNTATLIKQLISLGERTSEDHPYEILYGWSGYLYSLLLLDKTSPGIIPSSSIREHVRRILEAGKEWSSRTSGQVPPLWFEWHHTAYLGAAHGFAGILYILLSAREYMSEIELNSVVRPTLDWLITKRHPSGNFMSSLNSTTDQLVQWCHGSPGFTSLLILAGKIFNHAPYMKLAEQSGDVVWARGLLKKGYSLCHGVSGNAYSFLALYKETKDLKHLYRAAAWVEWMLPYPQNEGYKPDRPFSLYEGRCGIIYFINDMCDPLSSAFPGFEIE